MLAIENHKISKLYLGNEEIKKAYLGDTLVFSSAEKESRLPEGYTELQYISNPNYAAIANFGMASTFMCSTKMELDVGFVENCGGALIGTHLNDLTSPLKRYAYFITVNYQTKIVTLN